MFALSFKKINDHIDEHSAWFYYKASCVFDPHQLPTVDHDIAQFEDIPGLKILQLSFLRSVLRIYTPFQPSSIPTPKLLPAFWESMRDRFPLLAAIWMPVASVDVEYSFSQYKHLLNDRREGLSEENTESLVMLYHNAGLSLKRHTRAPRPLFFLRALAKFSCALVQTFCATFSFARTCAVVAREPCRRLTRVIQ